MRRQLLDRTLDAVLDAVQKRAEFAVAHQIGDRMILCRHNALTEHDLKP